MRTRLLLCFLLMAFYGMAGNVEVTTSDFATKYAAAEDGDVLLMAAGTYSKGIDFPSGKTVTLKAAEGANVEINFSVSGNDVNIANGGLIFDGVTIKPTPSDYFISVTAIGDVATIAVKNSTITNVKRCFIRTENAGYSINNIEFDNCIITDCGSGGWNFIYPKHLVKNVWVKNSTLYNYTNGESFFCANQEGTDNVLTFLFENNTVYKWANRSDRALCKTEDKYNAASTYTFRNNIVTVPGVSGVMPQMVQISSGVVTATNNLVVNYGGYTGGTQIIDDLTLTDLGLTSIDFTDPDNGNFTILSTSPLATAGVGGICLGDPRWIVTIENPRQIATSVNLAIAGSTTPTGAIVEVGSNISVTATPNFGYRFVEWRDDEENSVSRDNPYSFTIDNDTNLTAVFEVSISYLAGWDFIGGQSQAPFNPNYTSDTQNVAMLYVYDENGNATKGKLNSDRSGKAGIQMSQAQNLGRNGYFQVEFSTVGYANIRISSYMLLYYFGYKGQKLQYAVGDGQFSDLTNAIEINTSTWTPFEAFLPAEADGKELVKVRWYPDVNGESTESSYPTSGNETMLADVFIYADKVSSTSYTRDMYVDGGFETICLPFDVTSITNGLGEVITPASLYEFGSHTSGSETLSFKPATEIEAHVPYLISMPQDDNIEKLTYTFDGTSAAEKSPIISSGDYSFVGTYSEYRSNDTFYVLNTAGDTFVKAASTTFVPAYRAYLVPDSGSQVRSLSVIIDDNGATDITTDTETEYFSVYSVANGLKIVTTEAQQLDIYGIDGRIVLQVELNAGENYIYNLAKGIYILNNQKVIIK